jgi:endonuclease/exonuclease/phosphatase family metal-dependent hydrolase
MKTVLFCMMMLLGMCREQEGMMVMFWNVENFYDYTDQGTGESDREFSSMGQRHWTKKKFYAKCDNIAKTIMWMGDRYGHVPDVIGFAEVENRNVLSRLLSSTLLRKYGYAIVHHDSGDRRGIDVALLYRRSVFTLVSKTVVTPEHEGVRMQTRDILHVRLRAADGHEMDFIVNHHPSKFGGSRESDGRRMSAMNALKDLCDSLSAVSWAPVVAMGDFNDNPGSEAVRSIGGTLVNKGMDLYERGEGSIRFEGKWDLIDMFLESPGIDDATRMEVCRVPFLMTWEKKHPGEKPLRTYSGPRYIGGISDHCPIVLFYEYIGK